MSAASESGMADGQKTSIEVREELFKMISVAMEEWQDLNGKKEQQVRTFKKHFQMIYGPTGPPTKSLTLVKSEESFASALSKIKFDFKVVVPTPIRPMTFIVKSFEDIFGALKDIKVVVEMSHVYTEPIALQVLESIRPLVCDVQGLMFPLHDVLTPVDETHLKDGFESLAEHCEALQKRVQGVFQGGTVKISCESGQNAPLVLKFNDVSYDDPEKFFQDVTYATPLKIESDEAHFREGCLTIKILGASAYIYLPLLGGRMHITSAGDHTLVKIDARGEFMMYMDKPLVTWTAMKVAGFPLRTILTAS